MKEGCRAMLVASGKVMGLSYLGWDNSRSEQLRGMQGKARQSEGAALSPEEHLLFATAFESC